MKEPAKNHADERHVELDPDGEVPVPVFGEGHPAAGKSKHPDESIRSGERDDAPSGVAHLFLRKVPPTSEELKRQTALRRKLLTPESLELERQGELQAERGRKFRESLRTSTEKPLD